jgi:hypothetical protein
MIVFSDYAGLSLKLQSRHIYLPALLCLHPQSSRNLLFKEGHNQARSTPSGRCFVLKACCLSATVVAVYHKTG